MWHQFAWVVCLAGTLSFSYNGWFKIGNDTNTIWSSYSPSQKSVGILCPIIPPSSFITPLFCSWPWSMVIKESFSKTWLKQTATCHFRILEQHQGWLHPWGCIQATHISYHAYMHEQTSIGHSECDLD